MNSFASDLKATLLGALKSKLELVAEFWSAKLHLNHRRVNLQTQFVNSRRLITYLAAKGLAQIFNPDEGVKDAAEGLDDWL